MSLKKVRTSSGLNREKSGKLFRKQINAVGALLTVAASIGVASGQITTCVACVPRGTPFMIGSAYSGLVISVPGGSTTPGTFIWQWPGTEETDTQWTFRASSQPGFYEIVSVSSGQVLDNSFSTTPGTVIQQRPANGGTNQQWTFAHAPGSAAYEIVSADLEEPACYPCFPSNLLLTVPVSNNPDVFIGDLETFVQQWTENDGINQQWSLIPLVPIGISMGLAGTDNLAITGWGFKPGTLACPVLLHGPSLPCATVSATGTFSATFVGTDLLGYYNSGSGYVTGIIQDDLGNVLAVGSVPGQLAANYPVF
jgi:hypothetical protein